MAKTTAQELHSRFEDFHNLLHQVDTFLSERDNLTLEIEDIIRALKYTTYDLMRFIPLD